MGKKTERIETRVSPAEKTQIDAAAEREGRKTADFVRRSALEASKPKGAQSRD